MKSHGFRDTGRIVRRPASPGVYAPSNLANLMRCLERNQDIAVPIRPQGAGSSATDCNVASFGTTVKMSGLDRIIQIHPLDYTVTAEAGVRLGALISTLAEKGLELIGSFD